MMALRRLFRVPLVLLLLNRDMTAHCAEPIGLLVLPQTLFEALRRVTLSQSLLVQSTPASAFQTCPTQAVVLPFCCLGFE